MPTNTRTRAQASARRAFTAALAGCACFGLGGCASLQARADLATQEAAPAMTSQTDADRIAVVQNMIDAWNTKDWDRVVELFGDDGSLHSMMVEPIVGREALAARIGHIGEGIEEITLNVRNMGVVDGVVFLERVDSFTYKGHKGSVPVVGVIEVEGDHIKEWREYYDRAELLEAMGLTTDFDAAAR